MNNFLWFPGFRMAIELCQRTVVSWCLSLSRSISVQNNPLRDHKKCESILGIYQRCFWNHSSYLWTSTSSLLFGATNDHVNYCRKKGIRKDRQDHHNESLQNLGRVKHLKQQVKKKAKFNCDIFSWNTTQNEKFLQLVEIGSAHCIVLCTEKMSNRIPKDFN